MRELLKNIFMAFALLGPFVSIICFIFDLFDAAVITGLLGAIGIIWFAMVCNNNIGDLKGNGHYPPYDWF